MTANKIQEMELTIGIEEYLEHLKAMGKKPSTMGTATRALKLLRLHLGSDKVIAKILPVHVAGFFKSEAATTLRGKPRAKASILQIRLIIRGSLVWWQEQGYVATAPLPSDEKRFLEPSESGKMEGDK